MKDGYYFEKLKYNSGFLDKCIDATYIIHLRNNGRLEHVQEQLQMYQPTKTIYIVFNEGYKNVNKGSHVHNPPTDLVDAFIQTFKHAEKEQYKNILILEDDFIFNKKIKNKKIQEDICSFLSKNHNKDFQYSLGCIPFIKYPFDLWGKHYNTIGRFTTHAVIYTLKNRQKILKRDITTILDWDGDRLGTTDVYMYHIPLCYQLFPDTENMKYWAYSSILISPIIIINKIFIKLLRLDVQIEPGYSIVYAACNILNYIITFILLILLILLILIVLLLVKKLILVKKLNTKISKNN
jgi:hypothetical protein